MSQSACYAILSADKNASRLDQGHCLEVLASAPDNSVDAIITDPPYDLTSGKRGGTGEATLNTQHPAGRSRIGTGGFMGAEWDATGIAFDPNTWRLMMRVLKPGGHLVAFGGTRTVHRMACAIEDAGFQIRDRLRYECALQNKYAALWDSLNSEQRDALIALLDDLGETELAWVFGQGFPKSVNFPKAMSASDAANWVGWGSALKPAYEPIILARKPLSESTIAANVTRWGVGGLNIDACRIGLDEDDAHDVQRVIMRNVRSGEDGWGMSTTKAQAVNPLTAQGRWPANVLYDGSEAVLAHLPNDAGGAAPLQRRNADKFRIVYGKFRGQPDESAPFYGKTGAAKFFYCAKAKSAEKHEGLDGQRNPHPTVKPVELMRWLVRLVVPKGALVLDPFMGSGSTGVACVLEGMRFWGIDRVPEFVETARKRIHYANQVAGR